MWLRKLVLMQRDIGGRKAVVRGSKIHYVSKPVETEPREFAYVGNVGVVWLLIRYDTTITSSKLGI